MKHSRLLEVTLSPDEVKERGLALADVCVKRSEIEKDRKKIAGEFNQKIKAATEEMDQLSQAMQDCVEEREVECDERMNKKKNVIEVVRLDTMEVIENRDIENEDVQENLLDGKDNEGDDLEE